MITLNACTKNNQNTIKKFEKNMINGISPASIPTYCGELDNPCEDPACSPYFNCGITKTYGGVNITYETTSGMLKFNSINDVNTVINLLDLQDSIWNTNYDAPYLGYTIDQMDYVDSINNFSEFKKFKEFENLFPGFISKRNQLETLENNWMNNNFTGLDPDSLNLTQDEAENTIFNSNNKFKIGSIVYELKPSGMYVNNLLDGSFATTSPCIAKTRNAWFEPENSNRRYKIKASIHSIGFRSTAKGKVVAFKRKSSGGWKRSRAEMAVSAGGNIYTTKCFLNFSFTLRKPSPNGFAKKRSLKVLYRQWGSGGQIVYRTKPNEFAAAISLPNGLYHQVQLN